MKWLWPSLLNQEAPREEEPTIWIFGYGSLIWNPGFQFQEAKKCCLKGYARRFWQGNMTYRGDHTLPGRVVTIVEDPEAAVTGLAFKVRGLEAISAALHHLHLREVCSGYVHQIVTVESLCDLGLLKQEKVLALTYVAKSDNQWFLGPDPSLEETADQIARARGKAGPNADYLLNLARSTREQFPLDDDPHLFQLEMMVLKHLNC